MNSPVVVHLSTTHPANDIRVFQKQCISLTPFYDVALVIPHSEDEMIRGVRIRAVPKATSRWVRMTRTVAHIYRAALKENAAVYHLHHPELIPAGILLKLRGKKVIYDTHEAYGQKILSMTWIPSPFRRIASRAFSCVEKFASRFWDHIIVADAFTGRLFPGRPVTVIANYPLLLTLINGKNAGKAHKKRVLIYVGDLTTDRGLDVMCEVARLLQPDVQLHLLGRFESEEQDSQVRSLPYVRYFGLQPLATVYEHLLASDIGLILLKRVPAYSYAGENTNKLFEYMLCSLPVVVSDFPNLRRIVDHVNCGICVEPEYPEVIAQRIAELLSDVDRCNCYGKNGRAAVLEQFNWNKESEKMLRLYHDLIGDTDASSSSAVHIPTSGENGSAPSQYVFRQ